MSQVSEDLLSFCLFFKFVPIPPPSLSIFIYSIVVHLSRRSKQVLTSLSILVLLSIAELVNTYHLQLNTYCNSKCIPQLSDQVFSPARVK
ncbi:hypothetical protein F5J12DRAFT_560186 [Pisolithus orientalis]|uniref:uncharacterized protein n=1 Tax=Pisolithus orientalis TaxID=936130 RepID=UPI002224081B|nr:uncharacterized protein F5J12DRAFT_560186 [Pisolithus orientalis]KAI5987272.1 hypothetical protein F5J12DRAFT_560186 [Pisolithus orientalis]